MKLPSMLPDAQGGKHGPRSPGGLENQRGNSLPSANPCQSTVKLFLSTTFLLIRLFFTRAVLIKGPLSTQNICSEVLLWLLMMPGIIKSGRNFQLWLAWAFLPAPPRKPPALALLSFHPLALLPRVVTLWGTDPGKQSVHINIQDIVS